MKNMLDWEQMGFALHVYADYSQDVLCAMDNVPFSLILINMKDSPTGVMQLCEHIRQNSHVPIILFGGNGDFHLVRHALALQVSDYIAHPVQASDLAASLEAVKKKLAPAAADPEHPSLFMDRDKSNNKNDTIIDVVKQYVQEELHGNITLKKISSLLHFNCAYLGQKFKDHVNMSFHEYLLQQRMEKAKMLLEKTDMRIYEIANEVGYTEIDWFYKKFKAYTGASANEYRKQVSITA